MGGYAEYGHRQITKVGDGTVKERGAIVTQNNVVALTCINQIAARAAKDQIGAGAGHDYIVIALVIGNRLQRPQRQAEAWNVDLNRTGFQKPAITQHDVRTFRGIDLVAVIAT